MYNNECQAVWYRYTKDGRGATVVGAFSDRGFRADVVGSPENRETVSITIEDIETSKKAAKGNSYKNKPPLAAVSPWKQ